MCSRATAIGTVLACRAVTARLERPKRVVFLVLDGFPPALVGSDLTPTLLDWTSASSTVPRAVEAVLPASTYANHATFATGVGPVQHGIIGNHVRGDDGRFHPASQLGPSVPTLFDAAATADVRSAIVVGDQELIGVMGGRAASEHWPLDGITPAGAVLDAHGYLDDAETLPQILAALAGDAQLVVAQLNSPDTAGHVHGPDERGARDVYHAVDRSVAQIRAAIEPRAADTFTIIVSDHSMEPVTIDEPVDLNEALDGTGLAWFPEGTAALIYGEHPDADRVLASTPGVAGMRQLGPGLRIAWADPGRWMCFHGIDSEPGMHGSPRTAQQLAAVVGAHPAVRDLDTRLQGGTFDAKQWAPAIAGLLGFDLPHPHVLA
ncbi:MAG: alkaline phosphatase family protein [Acidimicrobiia bacterium]|nr:alkaline phosphatase family protein [Acidimicrobiia bacterium]